ncbi:MAG: hypothetical protein OXU61_07645, partial [Gammaproteobacteria bacterium]|nr:hypothetical protein [Gammaproteobacteria bacterium]
DVKTSRFHRAVFAERAFELQQKMLGCMLAVNASWVSCATWKCSRQLQLCQESVEQFVISARATLGH